MSTVSPPQTISPTVPANLQQPLSGGTLGQCVLDNLSGYLLQVNVGPNVFYQAPLVEALYDLTQVNGAPVQVFAILLPGDLETSGVVAPTWFDVGELPDTTKWPIALSGPAEVAAATAAALLTSGIPSVLTTTVIATTALAGGILQTFNVAGYASLLILNHNTGTGAASNYGVAILQAKDIAGVLGQPVLQETLAPPAGLGSGWDDSIEVPVVAPILGLVNNSPDGANNVANLTIIGTNRALTRPYYNTSRQVTTGQRWIGSPAALAVGGNLIPGLGPVIRNEINGPVQIAFQIDDTTSAFTLNAQYADGGGNFITTTVLNSSQLTSSGAFRFGTVNAVLPAGKYWFQLFADIASAGNVNIIIDVKQNV